MIHISVLLLACFTVYWLYQLGIEIESLEKKIIVLQRQIDALRERL